MGKRVAHRREFLLGLTAVAGVGSLSLAAESKVLESSSSTGHVTPWSLLAPLSKGAALGWGWRIESISPVDRGALVLTLIHPTWGDARVHMCRAAGAGVVATKIFDFVLMNGVHGDEATPEELGRNIMKVASYVRRNEAEFDASSLLTHEQRLKKYHREIY